MDGINCMYDIIFKETSLDKKTLQSGSTVEEKAPRAAHDFSNTYQQNKRNAFVCMLCISHIKAKKKIDHDLVFFC